MLSPQGDGGFDRGILRVHLTHFSAYSRILVLCVCNMKYILWSIYISMGQQTDIFLEQLFRVFLLLDSELCLFLSGLTMLLRLSLSHVPKDCSTSGFPVHCLLEFAQTSVHSVTDTIHLPHPLPFPSLFASNLPQCQALFQ